MLFNLPIYHDVTIAWSFPFSSFPPSIFNELINEYKRKKKLLRKKKDLCYITGDVPNDFNVKEEEKFKKVCEFHNFTKQAHDNVKLTLYNNREKIIE